MLELAKKSYPASKQFMEAVSSRLRTVGDTGPLQGYVNIILESRAGRRVPIRALIDSGNSVCAGLAMSSKLFEKLGCKFSPNSRPRQVGTARKGTCLNILGQSEEIRLSVNFKNSKTRKFIVCESLSDDLNIGARFLKRERASIHFGDKVTMTMPPRDNVSRGGGQFQKTFEKLSTPKKDQVSKPTPSVKTPNIVRSCWKLN